MVMAWQVVLLLKSSDRASHDICHTLPQCRSMAGTPLPLVLALRKWHALRPEREFRCFVRGHCLIGESAARNKLPPPSPRRILSQKFGIVIDPLTLQPALFQFTVVWNVLTLSELFLSLR